jgi:hypothetical protein
MSKKTRRRLDAALKARWILRSASTDSALEEALRKVPICATELESLPPPPETSGPPKG